MCLDVSGVASGGRTQDGQSPQSPVTREVSDGTDTGRSQS